MGGHTGHHYFEVFIKYLLNINEYIASGILEEYVLGQLTAAQRAEVEAMAERHPEIRSEIQTIEEALAKYGMAHRRPMPDALKKQILDRIAARQTPVAATPKPASESGQSRLLWSILLGIMAVLLAWMWFQNRNVQKELKDLRAQQESSMADCDSIAQRAGQLEQQLNLLKNPGWQLVYMAGTEKSKSSQVLVQYNPSIRQTYLRVDALPAPAAGKQYQLWAIVAGAPVSMGVFDIPSDTSALIPVQYIAEAQAFAVTLENAGGVQSPTLEEMYVIGNVGG